MTDPQRQNGHVIGSGAANPAIQPWVSSHDVQFYQSEAFLFRSVGDYLATGVQLGQPIVVIATPTHRAGYRDALRARGTNPDDLTEGRDAIWLDARDTLAAFMEGGYPSAELFDLTVGRVLDGLRRDRRYVMVRAHGEMVDLLWRDGKGDAAIAVEQLWNALAARQSFSLLCTYSRESLTRPSATDGIERICGCHSRVLPGEPSHAA